MILMPRLKWKNRLDPSVDTDLLGAYGMLEKFGIRISKSTISSAVGMDSWEELEKSMKEFKEEKALIESTLGANLSKQFLEMGQQAAGAAKPPGGPGAGAKPPSAMGKPSSGGMTDESAPPGSAPGAIGGGALEGGPEKPEGGGVPIGVE
jgi:hypothetical protein